MLRLLREWLPIAAFVVADTSMRPALEPGDRLLVSRWPAPRRGDLVVVRDPEHRSTFMVKRLHAIEPNGALLVQGDNPNVSRDSRHFGPVPRHLMAGRAIFRYQPPNRRGKL